MTKHNKMVDCSPHFSNACPCGWYKASPSKKAVKTMRLLHLKVCNHVDKYKSSVGSTESRLNGIFPGLPNNQKNLRALN
jgi:hypothetical protein